MIKSVKMTGYRGLRDLSMTELGRVNLLVGKNNSGKTSVLEGLYLLATRADPSAIWRVLTRRGEQIVEPPAPGRAFQIEVDPCHLFYGHAMQVGTRATFQTTNGVPERSLTFEVSESKREANPALFAQLQAQQQPEGTNVGSRYMISITGHPAPLAAIVPLSSRGGLRQDVMQTLLNMSAPAMRDGGGDHHQFITTDSLSIQEVQSAFTQIALSPREAHIIRALQFIEPKVERIAASGTVIFSGPGWPTRGGLKVKLAGEDEPIPIGSLGEGTWRLLALAIALANAKDGLLLVDEIDTGLHYTVLKKMWTFVADAAQEFNVQVFATTHSSDCINSLAAVCDADVKVGSQVTIQRLEAERDHTIAYNEAEIVALARNHIEVR